MTAVIVAAGRGSRMGGASEGGTPKQFLPLCGVPVLARTAAAFEHSALVSEIVVVAPEDAVERARELLRPCGFSKIAAVVPGGATRQQSAAAGFAARSPDARYVAVHDGARPLITPEQIDAVVRAAALTGAATAAAPVKDTVKIAGQDGLVISTPDRRTLWAVQTPQVFEVSLYAAALAQAEENGADYTDDCQLVENAGARVKLVDCGYRNLKITTPEDLLFAQALLGGEGGAP